MQISTNKLITNDILSKESIRQSLPSIFIDSMVLDKHFNIVVVSQNVLDFLEFTIEEVRYKSINYLSGTADLASCFSNELQKGYIEERRVVLFTKSSRRITIGVSGFSLGMVSEADGFIILRINNLDEVELINLQLQQRKAELDNFIYRTAHDLRGPLATIKGLINLMRMSENMDELKRLIPMMDAHANKLDERLFQLVYLAQADRESESPANRIDFNTIETTLRKIIEHNAFVDFLEFHYSAPQSRITGINEIQVSALLNNLLLHILSQPLKSMESKIFFRITEEGDHLNVTVGSQGFVMSESLAKLVRKEEFMYLDMVRNSEFLNFYAVQKIALKLKAKVRIHFISGEKQRITIRIPKSCLEQ